MKWDVAAAQPWEHQLEYVDPRPRHDAADTRTRHDGADQAVPKTTDTGAAITVSPMAKVPPGRGEWGVVGYLKGDRAVYVTESEADHDTLARALGYDGNSSGQADGWVRFGLNKFAGDASIIAEYVPTPATRRAVVAMVREHHVDGRIEIDEVVNGRRVSVYSGDSAKEAVRAINERARELSDRELDYVDPRPRHDGADTRTRHDQAEGGRRVIVGKPDGKIISREIVTRTVAVDDHQVAEIRESLVAEPGRTGKIKTYAISYKAAGLEAVIGGKVRVLGKYAQPGDAQPGATVFQSGRSFDSLAQAVRQIERDLERRGLARPPLGGRELADKATPWDVAAAEPWDVAPAGDLTTLRRA